MVQIATAAEPRPPHKECTPISLTHFFINGMADHLFAKTYSIPYANIEQNKKGPVYRNGLLRLFVGEI